MVEVTDAAEYADACVAPWRDVHAALTPIVGAGGVAALYRRSLHLSHDEYPWMTDISERPQQTDDFAALREALSTQPRPQALAANRALLHCFFHLLTSLIGAPLTAQLLRAILDKHGYSVQDTSP